MTTGSYDKRRLIEWLRAETLPAACSMSVNKKRP
jgi:hypothetical protein